jgi:hypothetical protein
MQYGMPMQGYAAYGQQQYAMQPGMQYGAYAQQPPRNPGHQFQPQPSVVYNQPGRPAAAAGGATPAADTGAAAAAIASTTPKVTPVKRVSKAIRIMNPDSKEEVKVVPVVKETLTAVAAATNTKGTSSPAGTPNSVRKSKAIEIKTADSPAGSPGSKRASKAVEIKPTGAVPVKKAAEAVAARISASVAASAGADGAAIATAPAAVEDGDAAAEPEAPAEPVGPPPKAPAPSPGQWTPSNQTGAKAYSVGFMSAFRAVCTAPPPQFREDIETIMVDVRAAGKAGGGTNFKTGLDWMNNNSNPNAGFAGRPDNGQRGNGRNDSQGRRPPRGDRSQGSQGSQGAQQGGNKKVIHLPGRGGQASSQKPVELQKSPNAFVISTKKGPGAVVAKDNFKEITLRLNKLTLEKFEVLAGQIKDLLVSDLSEVEKLVATIFNKAIDEEFFSMIYAKLCKYLAEASNGDDDNTPPKKIPAIAVFRKTLLNCCQREFEKASLADAAAAKAEKEKAAEKKKEEAAEANADAGEGAEKAKPTTEEAAKLREQEREAGYARNKIKRHMLGNIRFIGELFKEDLVSSKIMLHCINHLMPNKNAEDENLENLCKLLDTAGGKWETQMLRITKKTTKKDEEANKGTVIKIFNTMKDVTVRQGVSSRIKFAVLDILDLRDRKWKPRMAAKGPKTISEVHAEANLEQIKIQQQSGGKGGGGGGGGRNNSGGGRDRGTRGSDGWTNVAAPAPRRPERVDASRFGGGSTGSGPMRLGGAPSLGGVRLGQKAKPKSGANPFAALANEGSKQKATGGGASPLLQQKGSSLLKKSGERSSSPAAIPAASPSPTPPAAAGPAVTPCKFSKEELAKKINGCLDEYLSIVDLNEVKESIKEWGHPDATRDFALDAIKKGAEASEKHRNLFSKLFLDIVGKEGGVPAALFTEAVLTFLPTLPDIMYDAPRAHEYIGDFVASASIAVPTVITSLLQFEGALKKADDDGGPELPLKLALAVFGAIQNKADEAKMLEIYGAMGASIVTFMASDAERVADLADRAGVKALLATGGASAAVPAGSATLESLLAADATNDQLFEFVDANVKDRSTEFVFKLSELIVLETSKKTTCATPEDMQKPPTAEKEAAELDAVKNRSAALKVYTDGSEEKQLHILCAVQAAVHKLKNPPGLLGRWFNNLYDMDVVLEDVFLKWETDKTVSEKTQGKTMALVDATELMDRLKNGAVEEDPQAE